MGAGGGRCRHRHTTRGPFPLLTHTLSFLIEYVRVYAFGVHSSSCSCVLTDKWTPVDEANGLLFSHSVPDLFAFLHTVSDAFWQHARSMHGYGVAASLPLLVDLLNNTLQQYSAHVLHTAGMDVLPHIYPTTDVKLKQAKAAPTDKVNHHAHNA